MIIKNFQSEEERKAMRFKLVIFSLFFLTTFLFSLTLVSAFNFETGGVKILSPQKDYYMEVAQGNIPGQSHINKFGHNPTASAGDDVWGGDGLYTFYPTTAQDIQIRSTSTDDDVGGIGAIQIIVQGLDENWKIQSETVTLDGTTPINLTNTYIRMFRAWVHEAGTSNGNVGNIIAEVYSGGDIAIFIMAENGQTQHTIYTVPAGKTAYFIKGYVGMATADKTAEDMTFQWLMRLNNGLNGAWLVQGEIGLVNLGSGSWQYEYGVPAGPIPEKTDIRIYIESASGTFNTVGGYDLVLVDNE